MGQTAFIPAGTEQARLLRSGAGTGPYRGCAVTPALLRAVGPQTTTEEAEFAALSNAGVLALLVTPGPTRLVIAAEVELPQITAVENALGEITISSLSWEQVRALFADETEAFDAVTRARRALTEVRGEVTLATALSLPEVSALLDGFDLLWFAPEELDHLGQKGDPTDMAANRAD